MMLSWLCCMQVMTAQNASKDSTDVFFRHFDLGEVIVQGLTGQTKMKNAPAPISIITQRELNALSATNIVDAIATQPGVAQLTTGSGIAKPVIRGLGYNRIVTISDGVRQEGQQWGDEHGIEIDGQDVHQVEILKGPASLMYGSDAMAGVLLMHGMPTLPEGEMKAQVNAEYQTNNGLYAYSLWQGGHLKSWTWGVRFSDKGAHAYKNKDDGYVPNSQFSERAVSANLGQVGSWGHSQLKLSYYQLTPSVVEGERDAATGRLEFDGDDVKTYGHGLPYQKVGHYKAVWDNALRLPKGSLKAIVGYQQNQRKEFEESNDEYGLYLRLHTATYDLRYETDEWQGWKLTAGIGGMWQRSENKGDEYLIPAYRLLDAGVFATMSKQISRWTLSGGLRYDHRTLHSYELYDDGDLRFNDFHRQFAGLTGSMGAVLNLTERTNIRLNLARGFRAPNLSELGANGEHEGTGRYEVGDNGLKAEYSWQADLGIDYASDLLTAQIALFANRISNFIYLARDAQQPGRYYRFTQGDARLLGFEAGFDVHPIHSLHLGSTFSMVDARQLNQPRSTRYLPFTPAPRWTADVKYELTHDGQVLNNAFVAIGMECHLLQNHYYEEGGTETATPSYTLLNASAGTDILVNKRKVAELYLIGENLTNRAYLSHLSRLKYLGDRGVSNMGRNITMKLVIPITL